VPNRGEESSDADAGEGDHRSQGEKRIFCDLEVLLAQQFEKVEIGLGQGRAFAGMDDGFELSHDSLGKGSHKNHQEQIDDGQNEGSPHGLTCPFSCG